MNNRLSKILSFIWDIPIEKTSSKYNEYLEVVWSSGKKMLNTRNANFSFGTCHDVFKMASNLILDPISKAEKTLILGFGCGSILQILNRDLNYNKQVVGVEYDNTIISLFHKHFANEIDASYKLYNNDALQFLAGNQDKFDIIFIDLFIELENNPILFKDSFFKYLLNATKKNGSTLVFNTTKKSKKDAVNITELNLKLSQHFKNVVNHNFQDLNNLIIAN